MKKATILILTCMVSIVLLVGVAVYLSSLTSEKVITERERGLIQAVNLAEAGLNQSVAVLKEKILVDLNNAVKNKKANYFQGKDSLTFLHDILPDFFPSAAAGEIRAAVTPISLNANIPDASFAATIVIRKQKYADGNDIEASSSAGSVFNFPYEFSIEATGSVPGVDKTLRFLNGKFEVVVQRNNFARFALFTNHHMSPAGERVWFTEKTRFYGPVHTNGQFSFANNPGADFGGEVSQHLQKAYFYNNGWPVQLDSDKNEPYDLPTFSQGFLRKASEINLESSITTNDLRQKVGYQSSGGSGIYIPNNGTSVTGGIYIKGSSSKHKDNATIALSTSGSNPVYTIRQNTITSADNITGSVTKTITVDYTANGGAGSTNIVSVTRNASGEITSTTNQTFQGVPDGTEHKGILIYSDDHIGCKTGDGTCTNAGVSGTVAASSQLTISSERDIVISDHIRYQEYSTSPSLNANDYTNLLGILSWGGDVIIGTSASSNLDIHAVIMAVHGAFFVDNYRYRAPSGDVNLLGGVISDTYGAFGTFSGSQQISGYGRNFIYDGRMYSEMNPPYYPTTTEFGANAQELAQDLDKMGLIWQQQ